MTQTITLLKNALDENRVQRRAGESFACSDLFAEWMVEKGDAAYVGTQRVDVKWAIDSAGNPTGLAGPGNESLDLFSKAWFGSVNRLPVFENFSRISEFTVSQTGATFAETTGGYIKSSCIKMTAAVGAGSNAYGTKNLTFNQNTVDGMWLLTQTNIRAASAVPGVTLYASEATNLGSGARFSYSLPSTLSLIVGRQAIWIPKAGWSVLDGSPDWANDMLSYRVRVDSSSTDARDVDLYGILWGGSKPTVIITFDDGWSTSYSVGWVEAQKRGIPLTHYLIASLIGNASNITAAQAAEMKDSGDYIGLHGVDPWSVTTRIATDRAALVATGLSDCKHASYPEGDVGTTTSWVGVASAMAAQGVRTARLASNIRTPALLGYTDHLMLPAYPLSSAMSLADAEAAVDQAILSGGTVIFYGHKLAGSADSLTWVTSDYTSLLDYINQRRLTRQLDVTTIDKWYAQFAGRP